MSRPVDWTPLAERDPVPGDPDRLETAARHYKRVAEAIDVAATKLRRLAEHSDMQSEAVDTFRGNALKVAENIGRAHQRYAAVGAALTVYTRALREAQVDSASALREAETAEATRVSATARAEAAQLRVVTAPPGADTSADREEHRRATVSAEEAAVALSAVRARLGRVIEARDAARRTAVAALRESLGSGGLNDGWRDNLGGWLAEHIKPLMKAIDLLAAGLGVLALLLAGVPFLGAALGAAALTLSAASLIGHALLAATGEEGIGETVVSAIGLATFGLGKIAAGGFKVSARGAHGAARGAAGRWASRSPAERAAAGLPVNRDSARAIDEMMGTGSWTERGTARANVDRSLSEGTVPSPGEAGRSLAAIPGQTVENLKGARHWDVRHPIDQIRAQPTANSWTLLGEREAAAVVRELDEVHPVLRGSAEVAPHLEQMAAQQQVFRGAFLTGGGVLAYESLTLGGGASTAERLNLSGESSLFADGSGR